MSLKMSNLSNLDDDDEDDTLNGKIKTLKSSSNKMHRDLILQNIAKIMTRFNHNCFG